jgi:N6-L-threonylcarbamoyladenine synthase
VLVSKTMKAAARLGVRCVTASGGVTANRALRRELASACNEHGLQLRLAPIALCTDNAAIVGLLAERKLELGWNDAVGPFTAEVRPGWPLQEAGQPG